MQTPRNAVWQVFSALAAILLTPLLHAAADNKIPANATSDTSVFRGRYFAVRHPANFKARAIDAASPREADAATFTAADGTMAFYVFAPLWAGDAPEIAFDAARETEISRKTESGKSSGVAGKYAWVTIAAKDKSYTRLYQHFNADDGSIHWVIGIKYRSDDALQRYKPAYAKFKASFRQFAD